MVITRSEVDSMIHALYVLGIVAESMTGTIAAGKKQMDIFGVVSIAVITALGGGTIRNIILGVYPMTWVSTPLYVLLAIIAALLALPLVKLVIRLRMLFLILDAAGLVTFAYLGSIVGFTATHSVTIATLMAIVTGVSGGIIRDVLCNDIPLVFRSELYAMVAFLVGLTQSLLLAYWHNTVYSTMLVLLTGFILRMWAIVNKVHLPFINYQQRIKDIH
jgi:uncharacterized membrane protein YeiH